MAFVTEVKGDALEAMQDVWNDVESFTRAELGGVPDWADYVDLEGRLWSNFEAQDMFADSLGDSYGTVSVCGYEFDAGYALRELDPTAFRCGLLDWLDAQVCDGFLRRIEG